MNSFYPSQKLLKLKYLLQNSKIDTIRNSHPLMNSLSNLRISNFYQETTKNLLVTKLFSEKQINEMNISKDLSLFLNLLEKPLNLLFSIDQFLFEFSKRTYQQKKIGEFSQQLKERKKLSLFYGNLTQKQLSNLLNRVKKTKGYLSKNIFLLLEKRLDITLYRSGLIKTVAEAQQLIKHQKILVNQKVVDIPGFLLTPGDFISILPKTKENLNHQLLASIKTPITQNHPKVIGDFYSKLKKTMDSTPKYPLSKLGNNQKQGKESKKTVSSFSNNRQSKKISKLFILLMCVKIQSRSFCNFKKSGFYLNKTLVENSMFNKSILVILKWKSLSKKKQFFSKKFFENSSNKKYFLPKLLKKNTIYANQGCLQKNLLFWNKVTLDLKQKKNLRVEKSKPFLSSFQKKLLEKKIDKKNSKFFSLKRKNLEFYRKSFFLFLRYLENYKKCTNLITFKIYKSLSKIFFSNQKILPKKMNLLKFSKNLNFRLTRPLNIEVSYALFSLIYLYSPQRINFPFFIDIDLIERSLR